jgi:hypothetical protein
MDLIIVQIIGTAALLLSQLVTAVSDHAWPALTRTPRPVRLRCN